MFKVPTNVPQDLLLIQEFIQPEKRPQDQRLRASSIDSSTASTADTTDSEEEEAVETLLEKVGEKVYDAVKAAPVSPPSEHDSDDSSSPDTDSESESDDGEIVLDRTQSFLDDVDDEEDDGGNKQAAGTTLRTKNEIPEPTVVVPDFSEVDANEPLERVGEVMSIFENVVIVKGTPSPVENKAAERALDSDSLLVFEDRKVLGYVHETFGPTHLPLYQVKFTSSTSIDKTVVHLARAVYHVPNRSKFIFPSQLAKFKGSDASNVHDEEIGEDEVEFSDDEAEAAYKRQRARDRESRRSSSVASSRHSTPIPSQLRDQELMSETLYGASPYDEYTPYDMDHMAGPSRPTPLPYDDPYAEGPTTSQDTAPGVMDDNTPNGADVRGGHANTRARGRHNRGRGRGRDDRFAGRTSNGSGNDQRGNNRSRGGGRRGGPRRESFSHNHTDQQEGSVVQPRPLSPTSLAIARATGQLQPTTLGGAQPMQNPYGVPAQLAYQQSWQHPGYGAEPLHYPVHPVQEHHSHPYVQPHINPRFASQFAMNMNFLQSQQPAEGFAYGGGNWSNAWPQNMNTHVLGGQQGGMANGGGPTPDARAFSDSDQRRS